MAASQETQVRASEIYDATLDNTQAETLPTSLQDDMNILRTLVRLIVGSANWYDTPATDLATLAADTTPADLVAHVGDASIHFTEASINHANILNAGTNTHAQIDAHIADTANPHGLTPASIGASPSGHTHLAADVTDLVAAVDAIIVANASVVANTAKVSADGSIGTHSDVDTAGINIPSIGDVLVWDGMCWQPDTPGAGGSIGNVAGPGSSTDNALVRWDGATGQLVQNSGLLVSDVAIGQVALQGAPGVTMSLKSDVGLPMVLRYGDNTPALIIESNLAAGITLGATAKPAVAGSVDLGGIGAGEQWSGVYSHKFVLEEGLAQPVAIAGFSQLFMDQATNKVFVLKGDGSIVDLEVGTGGGSALASQRFVSTLGQTVYTLSQTPTGVVILHINGIEYFRNIHYTVAGSTVTLDTLALGFTIEVGDEVTVYFEA